MSQLKERPRVLIAEGEEPLPKLLYSVMQDLGLEPLEASTGELALELLEQNPIDLLLVDIGLPGIDGMQVLREAKVRDRGAADFLTKPFSPKDLIAARMEAVASTVLTFVGSQC